MGNNEEEVLSIEELRFLGESNYISKEKFINLVRNNGLTISPNSILAITSILNQEMENTDILFDGHHTVGELYTHRITLFLTIMGLLKDSGKVKETWYADKHHDGEQWGTSIITGITLLDGSQVTYHMPKEYRLYLEKVANYKDYAPEYDGHTSNDVLNRLANLVGLPNIV